MQDGGREDRELGNRGSSGHRTMQGQLVAEETRSLITGTAARSRSSEHIGQRTAVSMQLDLFDLARRPFLDVAQEIAGSLVYLDAGAGEVAASSLGLPFLLGEPHHTLSSAPRARMQLTPMQTCMRQASVPPTYAPWSPPARRMPSWACWPQRPRLGPRAAGSRL